MKCLSKMTMVLVLPLLVLCWYHIYHSKRHLESNLSGGVQDRGLSRG